MKTSSTSSCPFQAAQGEPASEPKLHPRGAWPPGPPAGLTGWKLLLKMSRNLPGAVAEWRQAYGGIVHLRMWPEHQVIVSEPELVRELLVTNHEALIRWERGIKVFSQIHGRSVLTAEGEPWRTRRAALQPAFAPKAAQALVGDIEHAAERAFSTWRADGQEWPIEGAFTALAMDVIVRTMFSSEIDADARSAEQAIHDVQLAGNAEMFWPASWPDWMPWKAKKRKGLQVLDRLIKRYIKSRLRAASDPWPDDLLGRLLLLHLQDPVAWPLQAVRDECMTTFLAGHETVAATLTWWAWCMAAHPEAQAMAAREVRDVVRGSPLKAQTLPALSYLTQTLQETLRLYPAAPFLLSRRALRPITLGAWQLPARTMFLVPVQLMHHDARWFPNPLAYRPERFDQDASPAPRGALMPFGTGPRVCLGQHMAMTEMTVIAAKFLQHFTVKVPDGMAAPEPVFNITLRPREPLRLALYPGAS